VIQKNQVHDQFMVQLAWAPALSQWFNLFDTGLVVYAKLTNLWPARVLGILVVPSPKLPINHVFLIELFLIFATLILKPNYVNNSLQPLGCGHRVKIGSKRYKVAEWGLSA
jgi:hypothetical protein